MGEKETLASRLYLIRHLEQILVIPELMGVPHGVVDVEAASHHLWIQVMEIVVPPEKRHPVRVLSLEADYVLKPLERLLVRVAFIRIGIEIVSKEYELRPGIPLNGMPPEASSVDIGNDYQLAAIHWIALRIPRNAEAK